MNTPALRSIRQELAGAYATLSTELIRNCDDHWISYTRKRIARLEAQERELLDIYIANPIVGGGQ